MTPADLSRWLEIDTGTGCWRWIGHVDVEGTPVAWTTVEGRPGRVRRYVRRWLYELRYGPVAPGLSVSPTCGQGWCMNPSHAKPVGAAERARLAKARGVQLGHCNTAAFYTALHRRAKLDWDKVREIRRRADQETDAAIAADMGVCKATIARIRRGEIWIEPHSLASLVLQQIGAMR